MRVERASFDPFFTFFLGGVAAFEHDLRVGAVGVQRSLGVATTTPSRALRSSPAGLSAWNREPAGALASAEAHLTGRFGRPDVYVESCPSTQESLPPDVPEGAVAVADLQTSGRGRHGQRGRRPPGARSRARSRCGRRPSGGCTS